MSRPRLNKLGGSGDCTSMSARWRRCGKPTRWRRVNGGAPGIDGVTFEAIEESGAESFLTQNRDELVTNTYRPMGVRKKEIPKDGGKVRVLSIPAIRDRVVQGALKLILEPIFEADFQPGSFGYRPKKMRRAEDDQARTATSGPRAELARLATSAS